LASEIPERCELKGIEFYANHGSFYHGQFEQIEFLAGHIDDPRLSATFDENYAYEMPAEVYYRASEDVKFEVGLWNEFIFDTSFVYNGEDHLLLEFRYNGCSSQSIYNLGWRYGGSDRVIDGLLDQETGWPREMMPSFRLIFRPLTTVSAQMSCSPSSGTLPFSAAMSVNLVNNMDDQARTATGHIDLLLGNGVVYDNWRSGWVDLEPGGGSHRSWSQAIPAHYSFFGSSEFRLVVEDVTPAPYNQPPYLASGDVSSRVCTVVGAVPE
jgi:hypothetical protein